MEILVQRHPSADEATIGELSIDGVFECFTLEDEVRDVSGRPVAEWKIHGRTAIPAGKYRVTLEHSPRFGPNTITLNGVEGFVGIRVHGGNKAEDTEGCPIVGDEVDGNQIKGGTSQPALWRLKVKIVSALDNGDEVWWGVVNP